MCGPATNVDRWINKRLGFNVSQFDPGTALGLKKQIDYTFFGKEAVNGAKQETVNPQYASQVGLFKSYVSRHGLGGPPK